MTTEAKTTERPPARRVRVGEVTSISGNKSVVVTVETLVKHARYGKYIRRRKKFQVHDEQGQGKLGATVEIVPCRPMSKTKAHRLVRVVRAPLGEQA